MGDPYATLEHQFEKLERHRRVLHQAIALIEDDRPNAARRLMEDALAGRLPDDR